MEKVLVIIPAKADSTRFVGKNKQVIQGKTLVEHAIKFAQASTHNPRIVVSTEDLETKQIALNNGVEVIHREKEFMGDREVMDVYVDVYNKLNDRKLTKPDLNVDYVIGLQPDNPDRNVSLDEGLEYFINLKYDDLVTVGPDGSRNGALRITRASHIESGYVSRRVGTILDNCTNIHSKNDLTNAEKNINERVY
jgi:CMP-N,N'-diacetyllegionaminic acid synthase